MKFLIITMGSGETSQGVALGKYIIEKNHQIDFILLREDNLHILQGMSCKVEVNADGNQIKSIISNGGYDAVVLCNSKMMFKDKDFREFAPPNKSLVVSLDSNWLFNQPEHFPYIQWLDRIFLNFPQIVYKYGLKENGGVYFIPEDIQKKIETIGLIPSYKPLDKLLKLKIRAQLNMTSEQKLIFTYIGSGITFCKDCFEKYIQVMDEVYDANPDIIRAVYLSGDEPKKPWLIPVGRKISTNRWYELLASSDLVFQHNGLGTLEQAIAVNIPAIANVSNPDPDEQIHTHAWEIGPFERAGLCKMHFHDDKATDIINSIMDLLFSKVKTAMLAMQKEHYSIGEEKILAGLVKLLENKSRTPEKSA